MSYDIFTGLLKSFPLPKCSATSVNFLYDIKHKKFNELRTHYPISDVAGNGSDIEKAVNLLNWVSANMYHYGQFNNSIELNSLDLLKYSFQNGNEKGINCVGLATILTECLLAVGMKARTVFILPCSPYDCDNHCVTHVYINNLDKWIMLDPTLNTAMKNEAGEYLSLLEIREHLANQQQIDFSEDANYNNMPWTAETTQENMRYFAKNVFYFTTYEMSSFGAETINSRNLIFAPLNYDVKQSEINNIKYRIKLYGDNPNMQTWLENTRYSDDRHYCSTNDFEATP